MRKEDLKNIPEEFIKRLYQVDSDIKQLIPDLEQEFLSINFYNENACLEVEIKFRKYDYILNLSIYLKYTFISIIDYKNNRCTHRREISQKKEIINEFNQFVKNNK